MDTDDVAGFAYGVTNRVPITEILYDLVARYEELDPSGDLKHLDGIGREEYTALAQIKQNVTNAQLLYRRGGVTWQAITDAEMYQVFAAMDLKALDERLVRCLATLVAWLLDVRRRRVDEVVAGCEPTSEGR